MTSLLSPGIYTMTLRSISEPKKKGEGRFLVQHIFGIEGDLSNHHTWLFFSNSPSLYAYLCAAPSLIGKEFQVEVKVKKELVGNREISYNQFWPNWEFGVIPPVRIEYLPQPEGVHHG